MLQLDIRDTTLDRYMQAFRLNLDCNPLYTREFITSRFRGRNINGLRLGYPELPYLFNLDKVVQNTLILQDAEGAQVNYEGLDNVLNAFEEEYQDNRLYIIRVFAYDYKILDDYFNEKIDYIVQKDNNISALFNKTMLDTIDRNGVTSIPNAGVRIYNHKEKNIIYEVLNYNDTEQASDYFLLLGIIPMLYSDIKDKLNEDEKKYLKELIRRSQVKRVRNVEVENYFYAMYIGNKYKDAIKDLRLKAELESIIRARTDRLRSRVRNLLNSKDNILVQYEQTLNDLRVAQKNLDELENNDTFLDEVKTVLDLPFVIDIHVNGTVIYIIIKTELEFYDPELLEINLANTQSYASRKASTFFKEVFIEGKYKYTVSNRFRFYLDETTCQLPSEIAWNSSLLELTHSLFNPHIEYFRCYGNNERAIVEAHQAKDIVGFINACLIALKNVNFADAPVFRRWYNDINNMLNNNYGGDATFVRAKTLLDTETGEYISMRDWSERYERNLVEEVANAPEIDVHVAGEEPIEPVDITNEPDYDDDYEEEDEEW